MSADTFLTLPISPFFPMGRPQQDRLTGMQPSTTGNLTLWTTMMALRMVVRWRLILNLFWVLFLPWEPMEHTWGLLRYHHRRHKFRFHPLPVTRRALRRKGYLMAKRAFRLLLRVFLGLERRMTATPWTSARRDPQSQGRARQHWDSLVRAIRQRTLGPAPHLSKGSNTECRSKKTDIRTQPLMETTERKPATSRMVISVWSITVLTLLTSMNCMPS